MKGIKLSTFATRCVLLTTCCALLTACSQTDETEVLSVSIGFVPTVEAQTRGTEFTKDNLTSLGVLAYLTQGNSFNALSSTPNFMYNQEVTKATGASTWEYTPTKFWPTNSNDKITFFAYAPHNAKGLTLPAATDRGYPSFTYQVQVAEAAQIDLLVCTPLMNQTYATNNGKVKFVMNHALTKIAIYVKNNDNVSEKTITAFSIRGVKSGTLTFQSLDTDSKDSSGIILRPSQWKHLPLLSLISLYPSIVLQKRSCFLLSSYYLTDREIHSASLINIQGRMVLRPLF